jgi:hypothetical protein
MLAPPGRGDPRLVSHQTEARGGNTKCAEFGKLRALAIIFFMSIGALVLGYTIAGRIPSYGYLIASVSFTCGLFICLEHFFCSSGLRAYHCRSTPSVINKLRGLCPTIAEEGVDPSLGVDAVYHLMRHEREAAIESCGLQAYRGRLKDLDMLTIRVVFHAGQIYSHTDPTFVSLVEKKAKEPNRLTNDPIQIQALNDYSMIIYKHAISYFKK